MHVALKLQQMQYNSANCAIIAVVQYLEADNDCEVSFEPVAEL